MRVLLLLLLLLFCNISQELSCEALPSIIVGALYKFLRFDLIWIDSPKHRLFHKSFYQWSSLFHLDYLHGQWTRVWVGFTLLLLDCSIVSEQCPRICTNKHYTVVVN